ncbi:MAG: GatB/YqeY domain-containing protein [Anaerolineaceae bacterium]|nr:GatB/YqeY domain-containing protein [Anaerolineaceae bacterium]
MKLKERLQADLIVAMKSKDVLSKNIIRGIMSAVKYVEVEKAVKLESDEEYLVIIQKEIKMRNDAIEEARKGNRDDIIESNEKELENLKKYLPEQLSDEEISGILKGIIEQEGASSQKDMGKVMPIAIKAIAGRAANSAVSKVLRDLLLN